ncbi:MAG: ribonuclease R [Gammaproteobacteria bacterium]|nr:ribonuclease R [Gammaproteobacteria bacterium]
MSKSKKAKDPFAAREAGKYDNPIPSREFILQHLENVGEPVSHKSLCDQLKLTENDQSEALRRRLIAMSRDGQVISNRRGVFGLADHMGLIKGRVQGNKDGYGFFVPADGSEDLFLNGSEMQKVFDGDTVLARMSGSDRRGRKEGVIIEVLERKSDQIVGRFYWEQGFGIIVPDNQRIAHEILVPEKENRGAQDGQFVVAELTSFPAARRKPIARIVEVLGDSTTPGLEIEVAIRSHGIPHQWPAEVKKESSRLRARLDQQDLVGRKDFRKLPFVTIDGEDAKDFDDAVYAESHSGNTWKLYVAIADVSHYVPVGSALDIEAQNRGNSVYFPGHVVPMLPEKLSNGLCSLKPKVDRLVIVCEMEFSNDGNMLAYRFVEGVIHSHARMTYSEVADILQPANNPAQQKLKDKLRKRHAGLVTHLEHLYSLYKVLRANREKEGALEFDTTETRIVFGETRKIREIVPVVRNDAHRLIEECMLRANVATAKLLEQSKLPVLYRVHEGPNPRKLENLREFLSEMGLVLAGGEKPSPEDYHAVLKQVVGRADAHLLQTMIIRSLMQAVYQQENLGHFGLGFPAYTHFTSPIRRYPDLLVHRAIRFLLRGKSKSRHLLKIEKTRPISKSVIYPYDNSAIEQFGEVCSLTERRADAASYDVIDWLKCEYVLDRIGDQFHGTVSSVTNFGLFVELDDIFIEGLVHISELQNDYYHFDPVRHQLQGERSNKTYHLGDSVEVKIVRVALDDRKIDLQILGESRSNSRNKSKLKAIRSKAGNKAKSDKRNEKKGKSKSRKSKDAKNKESRKKKLKSKEARGNKKSKEADEAGKNKKKAKKHKSRIGRPNARKRVKR